MAKYNTHIITDEGERVDFTLDIGARKKYSLAIVEGSLVVRVPTGFEKNIVPQLIAENIQWIHENLTKSAEKIGLPKTYEENEKIRLLGEIFTINYVLSDTYKKPEISQNKLIVYVCKTSDKQFKVAEVNKFIADLAKKEVSDSMDKFTKLMNLYPTKITLKSMTASWGRCSSNKTISINYKLIQFPKECCDYVCIHELCHLVHLDHSSKFWELVGKFCPSYKRIRDSMK